ncbi:MAG: hypothetical protein NTY06_02065 [Candidatus Gottesmanbacteria bacterium]|nr:hypothetical protein [Candidatus Gottesmanbacteria bacterium]
MTATAHALVAAAIARAVPNPYLAIPLAITSHFIMDAIPHWDIGTDWRTRSKIVTGALAIAETVLGITLAYFLFRGKVETPLLLSTIIAGELPDWLEAPWYIFFANKKKSGVTKKAGFWERFTYRIYRRENAIHSKAGLPLGVITQIVTVAFFLVLLG